MGAGGISHAKYSLSVLPCANTTILEVAPSYAGLHSEIIDGSFTMEDGMVLPPDSPGLGIRLTDELKSRYPFIPGSGEIQ